MKETQSVRAVYGNGILRLLEPVNLPEGVQVRVQVEPVPAEITRKGSTVQRFLYPTRPQPAASLERLVGLSALGGDALADSEGLYDANRN